MTGDIVLNIIKGREMTAQELYWHHDEEMETEDDVVVQYYGEKTFIGEILYRDLVESVRSIELKDGWVLVISEEYNFKPINKIK